MDTIRTPLRIVGTSHISERSAKEIRKVAEQFQPAIIAVELDKRRLQALLERKPGDKPHVPFSLARQIGVTGWLFLRIASTLQRKLGSIVKVEPGVDMLAAVQLAKEKELQLALIDRDILVTTRRMSQAFGWREKRRLLWDILSAPFAKEKVKIDLKNVPEKKILEQLMGMLKDRYPSLYKVLIEERNVHMCVALDRIARQNPGKPILLVVGAGHEEDLRARLSASSLFELT